MKQTRKLNVEAVPHAFSRSIADTVAFVKVYRAAHDPASEHDFQRDFGGWRAVGVWLWILNFSSRVPISRTTHRPHSRFLAEILAKLAGPSRDARGTGAGGHPDREPREQRNRRCISHRPRTRLRSAGRAR